jgi:hypothetical protein
VYSQNNNEQLPTTGNPDDGAASLALLYPEYLPTLRVFSCPSTDVVPNWPLTEDGCSYQYLNMADSNGQADTIIAYDKEGNHENARNVLHLDAHVSWMTEDQFQRQLMQQQLKPPAQAP